MGLNMDLLVDPRDILIHVEQQTPKSAINSPHRLSKIREHANLGSGWLGVFNLSWVENRACLDH